ncbi:MAG: four helix bundle protein [Anaerolineae bacterium]
MVEPMKFEELRVLQAAEVIADAIWQQVMRWKPFERDTIGAQLARAADSIGANVAESYGRFHFGEKLQFLYYARGSLFETKYWLNRTATRDLIPSVQVQDYMMQLTDLARQLNNFSTTLKSQRHSSPPPKAVREASVEYAIKRADPPTPPETIRKLMALEYALDWSTDSGLPLFAEDDLTWLQTIPNT